MWLRLKLVKIYQKICSKNCLLDQRWPRGEARWVGLEASLLRRNVLITQISRWNCILYITHNIDQSATRRPNGPLVTPFDVTYEMHAFHPRQYICTLRMAWQTRRGKARWREALLLLASLVKAKHPPRSYTNAGNSGSPRGSLATRRGEIASL